MNDNNIIDFNDNKAEDKRTQMAKKRRFQFALCFNRYSPLNASANGAIYRTARGGKGYTLSTAVHHFINKI